MRHKTYDERIERTEDIHTELMDLIFRMHMDEDVDYHEVMNLLKDSYTNQLVLISMLHEYEKLGVR